MVDNVKQHVSLRKLGVTALGIITMLPILAFANSDIEKAQCRLLGHTAFKVMLSHQTSDIGNMNKGKTKAIVAEDWNNDIVSSGLKLLASQVNQHASLDKKFAVSEKFENLVIEKCLTKQLGPLQQFVGQIEVNDLKVEMANSSEEVKSWLPLLKELNEQVHALKAENEKQRSMILAMSKERSIGNKDSISEIEQVIIELSAASEVIQETLVDEGVRGSAVEYKVEELDERMLFAEQDLDAIVSFRQETNQKLHQLQEQIRTLQYSE